MVEKVTWSGGAVPSGEDALFEFLGEASSIGTYSFEVEQTYSNGSIVDWVGPESSAAPAPPRCPARFSPVPHRHEPSPPAPEGVCAAIDAPFCERCAQDSAGWMHEGYTNHSRRAAVSN